MIDIRLHTIGEILDGDEVGRFVEVLDDFDNSGGYLIMTYADESRSPEVFDAWVENIIDVENFFEESSWTVQWFEPDESTGTERPTEPLQ